MSIKLVKLTEEIVDGKPQQVARVPEGGRVIDVSNIPEGMKFPDVTVLLSGKSPGSVFTADDETRVAAFCHTMEDLPIAIKGLSMREVVDIVARTVTYAAFPTPEAHKLYAKGIDAKTVMAAKARTGGGASAMPLWCVQIAAWCDKKNSAGTLGAMGGGDIEVSAKTGVVLPRTVRKMFREGTFTEKMRIRCEKAQELFPDKNTDELD